MGERRKKERRRELPKSTENLPELQPPSDQRDSIIQSTFCNNLVQTVLKDESSLSFSKPVKELWDMSVLSDYFEKIKNPMDLGSIQNLITSGGYISKITGLFDPNLFRYDLRLVFLNALEYNAKGTDLARLASKFLQFIDSEMSSFPKPGLQKLSQRQSFECSLREENGSMEENCNKMKTEEEKETGTNLMFGSSGTKDTCEDSQDVETTLNILKSQQAKAEAALAELELVKNVPMSYEENVNLRDEVESLPWETARKVVKILKKHVDEAVQDSQEEDPEYVTLEFSTIEPKLLRDIEALVRPDPRVETERKNIEEISTKIALMEKRLKKLPAKETGVRKVRRRR